MHVGIIGATGLVGQMLLQILEERDFPITELTLCASSRSVGKTLSWRGQSIGISSIEALAQARPQLVFMAAGSGPSREWAPILASRGSYVIDKSSAWRMDPEVPLLIPEINAHLLNGNTRIIASPNCSTSQLVLPLAAIEREYHLTKVIISTYQAVSGTGSAAIEQYELEREGKGVANPAYAHRIHGNCIPACGSADANGYTEEEMKLVHETQKILDRPDLQLSATAVRVPVRIGHGESVSIECQKEIDLDELIALLNNLRGVEVQNDVNKHIYPLPINTAHQDNVAIGRIRKDLWNPCAAHFWVMGDNLRKGAALNAIQIAESLSERGLLPQTQ